MDKIFRTPYRCTICGHLNFERFSLIQGEIKHRSWISEKCSCFKATSPEGYKPTATDDIYLMRDNNSVEAFEQDIIERLWHGEIVTGPAILSSTQGAIINVNESGQYIPMGIDFKIVGNVYTPKNKVDK